MAESQESFRLWPKLSALIGRASFFRTVSREHLIAAATKHFPAFTAFLTERTHPTRAALDPANVRGLLGCYRARRLII